jgi:hypothetical protein
MLRLSATRLAPLGLVLATGGCNQLLDIPPSADRPDASGGAEVVAECSRHADCLTDGADTSQGICRQGRCITLMHPSCPVVLPDSNERLWLEHLREDGPEPLILGIFSHVFTTSLTSTDSLNYDLALREVTRQVGGIPTPDGGKRRVVALVCDNEYPEFEGLDEVVRHLVDELEVPGVVSNFDSKFLVQAFERSVPRHVFYMNAHAAQAELLKVQDYGLMWHMLPAFEALAPTYASLLDRSVSHLRGNGTLGDGEPVKVALVALNYPETLGLSDRLRQELRFNGASPGANEPEYFGYFEVESIAFGAKPDHSVAIDGLLAFSPHVIVSSGGPEFLQDILPALEDAELRPFYLLSPAHVHNALLQAALLTRKELFRRIAGVNFAAAADSTAYDAYQDRFNAEYTAQRGQSAGWENYYDGIYYLLYAAAAAPHRPLVTGPDLAVGIRRLLSGSSVYSVGPADLASAWAELSQTGNSVTLNGTMGPPDFEPRTGTRATPGSVWCVDQDGRTHADVLRLNAEQQLVGDDFDARCFEFSPP